MADHRNTSTLKTCRVARLRPDLVEGAVAERVAKIFARAEQHMLNQKSGLFV
jgi:hypothetical protein